MGKEDQVETKPKLGPISTLYRARYRTRIASDADWGRPEHTTADRVCALVGIDPSTLVTSRGANVAVAGQAFTVALNTIVMLGDRGKGARLTRNTLFEALARYWSVRYRRARRRHGARTSYDMRRSTLRRSWRQLIAAGVNFDAIWDLLVRQIEIPIPRVRVRVPSPPHGNVTILSSPHGGLAQLYTLRLKWGRGHAEGRTVELRDGPVLDGVRQAIAQDEQYHRPLHRRVLLADKNARPLAMRHKTCEERPYDVVNLGQRSKDVLAILEASHWRFYVEQFREDFDYLTKWIATHQPQTWRQWRAREARRGTVNGWRTAYEQTSRLADLKRDADGRAYVAIRSRFFRAINRRFHAQDFWPEHVPGYLRERWFGPDEVSAYDIEHEFEVSVTQSFVESDVSSSQTQIISVFLGLDAAAGNDLDLEALATDPHKKFKAWLAERLWDYHQRNNVLAPGYAPNDERLIAFVKELWMRRNYGGKFGRTVRDLADDTATFGPGWNSNIFASRGITRVEGFWNRFLASLPAWSKEVTTFLDACQHIGQHADPQRGVVLRDPLDGARVRWNPITRAPDTIPLGKSHLALSASGVLAKIGRKYRFVARPFCIRPGKLANRVAPCTVHMMDAYFNALVLEYLASHDVTQVIAVHDGWFVPADFDVEGTNPEDFAWYSRGRRVVEEAITSVGQEWLLGLRDLYGWFVDSLKGSQYEAYAIEVRDRWERRVAAKRWPNFTVS
jgi:hypothetical protein